MPADPVPAIAASPHPCPRQPQRASPSHRCLTCRAIPCLLLARPRLASRALPRSVSPTSPNQQRQASASTGGHALPAITGLAVPSKAMPATPSHFNPDQSSPCLPIHALLAWPFRPDRAMPAGLCRSVPTLRNHACKSFPHRGLPSQPCPGHGSSRATRELNINHVESVTNKLLIGLRAV